MNIKVENYVSLNSMAYITDIFGAARVSLEKMCNKILGYKLPKELSESDWSAKTLTSAQVEYAARDARCSLFILLMANEREFRLDEYIPREPLEGEDVDESEVPQNLQECRVHLDPLHAMMRVTKSIPMNHPIKAVFLIAIRDAFFQMDQRDVKLVTDALQRNGDVSFEEKLRTSPEWILQRVRKSVGPAPELKEALKLLREKFSREEFTVMLDGKHVPLLSAETLKRFDELIEKHVECLVDPTDAPLYFQKGIDKNKLPLYYCARGTNSVESYHQWLERSFTPWCQGAELSDAVFTILRHAYNVRASERHRPNFPVAGHTHHWHFDVIQRATKEIYKKPLYSWWRHGLVGHNVSNESFGIVPKGDGLPFEVVEGANKNLSYICKKMGCSDPVLPVITLKERQLFDANISKYYNGRSRKTYDLAAMSSDWNEGKRSLNDGVKIKLRLQP